MKFLTRVVNRFLPSNARPNGIVVDAVVLHATAGASLQSSYAYLLGLVKDRASYHAGCDRDGTRMKMVALSRRAWHAGICYRGVGRPSTDVNSYSIGFAFANKNDGEKVTDAQVASAIEWINECRGQFPDLRYLTTHMGVAYPRKHDPSGLSEEACQRIARATNLTYVKGLRP